MTLEDSMPWLDFHSKLENKNKIVGDSYLHVQQKQQWLCVSASLPKPAASRNRSHQGREKRADEQWVGAPLPSYRRQSPLPSKLWTPNPPKASENLPSITTPHTLLPKALRSLDSFYSVDGLQISSLGRVQSLTRCSVVAIGFPTG